MGIRINWTEQAQQAYHEESSVLSVELLSTVETDQLARMAWTASVSGVVRGRSTGGVQMDMDIVNLMVGS